MCVLCIVLAQRQLSPCKLTRNTDEIKHAPAYGIYLHINAYMRMRACITAVGFCLIQTGQIDGHVVVVVSFMNIVDNFEREVIHNSTKQMISFRCSLSSLKAVIMENVSLSHNYICQLKPFMEIILEKP